MEGTKTRNFCKERRNGSAAAAAAPHHRALGKGEPEPDAAKASPAPGCTTDGLLPPPCHHRSPRSKLTERARENCNPRNGRVPPRSSSLRVPASTTGLCHRTAEKANEQPLGKSRNGCPSAPCYRRLSRGPGSRSLALLRSRATTRSYSTDRYISARGGSQYRRLRLTEEARQRRRKLPGGRRRQRETATPSPCCRKRRNGQVYRGTCEKRLSPTGAETPPSRRRAELSVQMRPSPDVAG